MWKRKSQLYEVRYRAVCHKQKRSSLNWVMVHVGSRAQMSSESLNLTQSYMTHTHTHTGSRVSTSSEDVHCVTLIFHVGTCSVCNHTWVPTLLLCEHMYVPQHKDSLCWWNCNKGAEKLDSGPTWGQAAATLFVLRVNLQLGSADISANVTVTYIHLAYLGTTCSNV